MVKFLKSDDTFTQDLSTGALTHTLTLAKPAKLQKITFHCPVNLTEIITITFIPAKGVAYTVVLRRITLVGKQDYVYTPDGENDYQVNDILKVECTAVNVVGATVISGLIKMKELN